MEQDRQDEENDLFYFEAEDVTELGLGEAARRLVNDSESAVFSFASSPRDFKRTPLPVVHGLLDAPYKTVEVPNCWTTDDLLKLSDAATPEPESWQEVLVRSRDQFDRLRIGDHCLVTLQGTPFSPALSRRIIALLGILQAIMQEMDESGALSQKGEEIRQMYFVGERALFSDESDTNKAQFKDEMTFVDPSDAEKRLTCFWHGKINTPKFRIHFDWPVSTPREGMKIPYIGPKISKK